MPRIQRQDRPGAWHHVYVRGAGGRTIFRDDADRAAFLRYLAAQVVAGRIVVFAYVLMTNHFHLLVMSPTGELGTAMRDVLRPFVLFFNPREGRDGPLFRSRFGSKPVDTHSYRTCVLHYIDRNPKKAGMVERSVDYRHGSAFHFHRGSTPYWLDQSWAEKVVLESRGIEGLPVGSYGVGHVTYLDVEADQLVEARVQSPGTYDPLAAGFTTHEARASFLERYLGEALRAGSHRHELPTAAGLTVSRVGEDSSTVEEHWHRKSPDAQLEWGQILTPSLMRRMTGKTAAETAQALGLCERAVVRRVEAHRALLGAEPQYRAMAHRMAGQILWGRERVAFC